MSPPSSEVPYGALDLMVLKTLDTMGAQHGYGIARRIEQMAEGMLALNQGTIYPALLRLEQAMEPLARAARLAARQPDGTPPTPTPRYVGGLR